MLYKSLNYDDMSSYGEEVTWNTDWNWMPEIKEISLDGRGYVLCNGAMSLLNWLGPVIYHAEYSGNRIDYGERIVVSKARLTWRLDGWTRKAARRFSCDCADRVKNLSPSNSDLEKIVKTARQYASGKATEADLSKCWKYGRKETRRAASAATHNNTKIAAWDAAWATTLTVSLQEPGDVASEAARYAALAKADAAWEDTDRSEEARNSIWLPAWNKERNWQVTRLLKYLEW